MIVCDTGPIVSAMNRSEGQRHRFAVELLSRLGRQVLVPWPVVTEVDLLLRSRGHAEAAITFEQALLDGIHQYAALSDTEYAFSLELARRYLDSGVDLPDLSVMAMAHTRNATILTWDYRHFRSVLAKRAQPWPLLVEEHELPRP